MRGDRFKVEGKGNRSVTSSLICATMGDDVGDDLYDKLLVSLLSSEGISAAKDMI